MFSDGKGAPNPQAPQTRLASHLALSDANQLTYFKDQGLSPVTNTALAQLGTDPYVSAWTAASRFAERDEVSQWTTSAEPVTIIGEEVQGALLGQKTAQAAIENMGKRLEAKMAELAKS
jgi:multiple sugar transport system substrate-binding protein